MDAHCIIKKKRNNTVMLISSFLILGTFLKLMCLFKKIFFVWLPWVFVAVCGLLSSCGMQASRCRAQALGAWVQC